MPNATGGAQWTVPAGKSGATMKRGVLFEDTDGFLTFSTTEDADAVFVADGTDHLIASSGTASAKIAYNGTDFIIYEV